MVLLGLTMDENGETVVQVKTMERSRNPQPA
jgi:hypothetical protein